MKKDIINNIVSIVTSQVLMRAKDIETFRAWLNTGSIDDDLNEIEISYARGERVDLFGFAMSVFENYA